MFKHLFFRLFLLTSILACLWFARNSIAHYSILQLARVKAGVNLTIGSTQLEPFYGTLKLTDVKIPDPQNKGQELASVDSVFVSLNTYELLKRQYHVENTEIRGIHYKVEPSDNELFVPQKMWERFQSRFPNWVGRTLNLPWNQVFLSGPDFAMLTTLKEEFKSAQLARNLSDKWTSQTKPVIEQSQNLVEKVRLIRDSVQSRNSQTNKVDVILGMLQQTETLDSDIRQVVNSAASLRTLAQQDVGSLRAAFQDDLVKIRELQVPNLDAQFISEVLIGPEIQERFTAILAWADSVGSQLTEQTENLETLNSQKFPTWFTRRSPGKDVRFASVRGKPDILASRTYFDGDISFNTAESSSRSENNLKDQHRDQPGFWTEKPIYFVGRAFDFAVSPKEWEKATTFQLCIDTTPLDETVLGQSPIQLESDSGMEKGDQLKIGQLFDQAFSENPLKTQILGKMSEFSGKAAGSFPRIYVTAVLNRKSEAPKDRYYIACPEYKLPGRILGNPNSLALSVSPGISQFLAELEVEGDKLVGKIHWTQSQIMLTPFLPNSLRGSEIERLLAILTQNINTINSVMMVGGTITEPQLAFHSDLGDRIAGQLAPALHAEWNRSKQVLANQLNGKMNESLSSLDSLFQQKLDPLVNDLRTTDKEWKLGEQGGYIDQTIQTMWNGLSKDEQNRVEQRLSSESRQLLQETAGNLVRGVLQDLQQELQKPNQPNEEGQPQPIQNRLIEGLMKRL